MSERKPSAIGEVIRWLDSLEDAEVCEFAGHDWHDAGGGMQVCGCCEAMRESPWERP